jgi:hypothetical protein
VALDVYVGSLVRYYTDDWENVAQRQAREQGMKYTRITPGGPQRAPTRTQVAPAIDAWCQALNRGLGANLHAPLSWSEAPDTPYFTDRPGYPGYSGLMLWAVYADKPHLPVPEVLPEGGWYEDPVFVAALERESGTRFRQIIQPAYWLPGNFSFCFQGPSPVGEESFIGSSTALVEQLELLNRSTFSATSEQLASYLQEQIEARNEVEHAAKFTLAVFLDLATKAVAHRLPMLISV